VPELANEFGIGQWQGYAIAARRSWKHVDPETHQHGLGDPEAARGEEARPGLRVQAEGQGAAMADFAQPQSEIAVFRIHNLGCGGTSPLPIGPRPFGDREVHIRTRDKSVLAAKGRRLLLVAAIGTPPTDFVWYSFTVESSDPKEDGSAVVSGRGWMLMPPQQVGGPDFEAFKNSCVSLADQYHIHEVTPDFAEFASLLIGLTSGSGDAYYLRGLGHLKLGLKDKAKADLEEALARKTRFRDEAIEHLMNLEEELAKIRAITEKEQLVTTRLGQERFRENVQNIEKACRISGVADHRFLIASHIKPWRDSNNHERLDGENGLLLTRNIDHLFDQGFISFADDGTLLISPVADKACLRKLGVPVDGPTNVGKFTPKQREYLSFHRQNIFRDTGSEK
jgi:hypothetical protein